MLQKLFVFMITPLLCQCAFANKKSVLVHGHRGARMVRPENTINAFTYALEVGVDVLELDLSVTKDNVLVVSHDPYVDNKICLDKNKKPMKDSLAIHTLTLKQIKEFDCGSLVNPRFPKQIISPGEKIPTLDEVFIMVQSSTVPRAKTVQFNIETKIVPALTELSPSPQKFAALLVEKIKKYGLEKRVIVQSFDFRTLVWVKKMNPSIRTSQLTYESMVDYVAAVKAIQGDIISPHHEWITKDQVEKLHAAGIQVAPWTANDEKVWSYLVDIGVDAIITDDPASLIKYLDKKKLRLNP